MAPTRAPVDRSPDDLREQFPIVRETLAAFRIPIFDLDGYEADDLIGTLSLQAQAQGIDTVIVSGDLDMLQLVSDHTTLMFTRMGAGGTIMYDPARIHERYGLTPRQMIDFKALKGDTTDNIPGLPGVGDKTAAKLLEDYGTLDGVFEHIDEVKPDKLRDKLVANKDDVLLWRRLVTIDRDAPVQLDMEAAKLGQYDRSEVIRLFREYEFRTLVERLPAVDGEDAVAPGDLLREADRSGPVPAAQVAGRAPRSTTLLGEGSGLQLSLDFDAPGGGATQRGRRCRGWQRSRHRPWPGHDGRSGGAAARGAGGTGHRRHRGHPTSDIDAWLAGPVGADRRRRIRRRAAATGHAPGPRGAGHGRTRRGRRHRWRDRPRDVGHGRRQAPGRA